MIRAYPDRATIVSGEPLLLHVSTDASRFHVRLFRWGTTLEEVDCASQSFPGALAPAKEAGIPWEWPVYELPVPPTARPGVYIATLDAGTSLDSRTARALFVLRGASVSESLLVVLPLFTYHAYNVADVDGTLGRGEGECLYSGAKWVSLHRPGGGVGGHPWDEINADVYDTESPRQTFAHWDAKAIAWLERNGFGYDCCTDLDLHEGNVDLARYRAIASFGHHEYWTQAMRNRVEAHLAGGGNVAFFGGNTCWFRADYDAAHRAIRRAGRWEDTPEWLMSGVSYAFGGGKWIGPRPPTGYRVVNAKHWVFDGFGLRDGDTFGSDERLVGYECDGAAPQSDLEILAHASIAQWPVADGSGEVTNSAHASLGIRQNGGTVFTASTVDWARVLSSDQPIVAGVTRNVLNRFLR